MSEPKASAAARLVDSLENGGQPGDFTYVLRRDGRTGEHITGGLNYVCPGCRVVGHLPFRKPGAWPAQPQHDWHWNANRVKPTLAPSIRHVGCGWHGHLVDGVFTSC